MISGSIKDKQIGFTLIELVVVTTIILVLFVVATVSFAGANQKARDSRRLTDLSRIQSALELYRQGVGNSYPGSLNLLVTSGLMTTLPADPKSSDHSYNYEQGSNGYTYNLYASLEIESQSNYSCSERLGNCVSCGSGGLELACNYKV